MLNNASWDDWIIHADRYAISSYRNNIKNIQNEDVSGGLLVLQTTNCIPQSLFFIHLFYDGMFLLDIPGQDSTMIFGLVFVILTESGRMDSDAFTNKHMTFFIFSSVVLQTYPAPSTRAHMRSCQPSS